MAAQTLDQVLASLGSIYDPQVQSVQAQQAQLPQQLQNDEQALQGQQTQAFDSILSGARSRGTGVAFGGIPLGEQAKYNATTYMPAAANLRSTYAQKGISLQDAINQINQNRMTQGQQMYQFGVQQDLAQQQFEEQKRQFDEQQKAAAAANSFGPSFGGGGTPPPGQPAAKDPYASINKTGAQASVMSALKSGNVANLNAFIKAVTASAHNGNLYDQYKLQLINSAMQPANNSAYNPTYANLIKQAQSYKAPAAKPSGGFPTAQNVQKGALNMLGGWFK